MLLSGSNINLGKLELQNARIQNLSSPPGTPVAGQIYYDTVLNKLGCFQNGSWIYLDAAGTGTVTAVSVASANGLAGTSSGGATPALTLSTTVTGVLKGNGTAISAAIPGTDYLVPAAIGASVQAYDATLLALAGLNTTPGVVVQTGVDTFTKRTLLGTVNRIVVTDGDAVLGNPVFDIGSIVLTDTSTHSLTNKTFNANGTGNSITNIETADFATNVIDNDATLAANSATRIATQQAVKSYIDGLNTNDMNYAGAIDASTNPNYPAATKGDYYKISVAGKIGGASGTNVSAGDAIIANTTNAGGTEAAVGTSWDKVQANVEQATTSTLGLVALADTTVAEAKSDTLKALTAASVANFPVKKIFTIGDGIATAIVVTHNLNTQDIIVSVRDATTNDMILVDIKATGVNTATITFAVAPASNSYKVVILG